MTKGSLLQVVSGVSLFKSDGDFDDDAGKMWLTEGEILVFVKRIKNPERLRWTAAEAGQIGLCDVFLVLSRKGIGTVNDDEGVVRVKV